MPSRAWSANRAVTNVFGAMSSRVLLLSASSADRRRVVLRQHQTDFGALDFSRRWGKYARMSSWARGAVVFSVFVLTSSAHVFGQWVTYPTPNVPRLAD